MTMPVTLADLNAFTIERIEQRDDRSLLHGRFRLPGQPSPGDGMNLFLGLDEDDVTGELEQLDPDGGTGVLAAWTSYLHPTVVAGASFPTYDDSWYTRVRLVLDARVTWTRKPFVAPDAFEQDTGNGGRSWRAVEPGDEARTDGRIVPGGWDHEECELCWKRIGPGGDPDAWVTDEGRWVCVPCHVQYVEPRDLRFLLDGARDDLATPPTPDEEAFDHFGRLINVYDLGAIRSWLDAGNKVDVQNRYGWTPLMLAALRGQSSLVALLLAAGADPSAVADKHGYTPLALAAQKGYVEVTRTLLAAGATTEVPATFWGGSLLVYVKSGAGRDNVAISEMLTLAGAR